MYERGKTKDSYWAEVLDGVLGLNSCLRPLWQDPPSSSSSGAEKPQWEKNRSKGDKNLMAVLKH